MKMQFNMDDIHPIIEIAVSETLRQIEGNEAKMVDRIAFPEDEAARLLGVNRHVLRDCRLRGEIEGSKVGKRIVYTRDQLVKFLTQNHVNG